MVGMRNTYIIVTFWRLPIELGMDPPMLLLVRVLLTATDAARVGATECLI